MSAQRIVISLTASIFIVAMAAAQPPAKPRGTKPAAGRQAKIARAMQAAPRSIAANATIMDVDGTILRKGSNGWTCMPGTEPGSTHPMCNDDVWMQWGAAYAKKAPSVNVTRVGISYMLAGDDNVNNADPFDKHQDPGETWVAEGPHLMIVVPDPKALDGISDDPKNGGPYVMWRGTPYAHLMVPVRR